MKKHFGKLGAMLIAVLMLVSMISTTAFAAVTTLPDDATERVLNIYKYAPTATAGANGDGSVIEGIATDRVPLQDVEFEIYKVPAASAGTVGTTPTADEITAIAVPANLIDTVKTNANGLATKSFGTGSANDGVYMIVEKDNPAVDTKVSPFYVSIPTTSATENAWLYTVTVYPKNDVPEGPGVDKDINEVGTDSASSDIGDIQTWIIRGDVPADLWRTTGTPATDVYAKNYSFNDTLNAALTYKGNLIVKLYTKADTEITLDAAYYDTTGTSAVDAAGGTVAVKLTNAGMKYIMQNLGIGTATPEIRVYFDTVINDTAVLATEIPNDVTLNYTNSANNEYDPTTVPTEDQPEVHTGGLLISKIKKGTDEKLEGATFMIARDATAAEIDAGGTETIKVGGENKTVVFVDFYDTDAIEGATVTSVATDATGKAVINGLAYGTYYLVETKAPDGYNLLSAPVSVTINDASHTVGSVTTIENSAKFVLPVTGGEGTVLFTMGGVLLIGMAGVLLVLTKKKKVNAK